MRRPASRVSFLVCPFCVRALMATEATQPSLHLLEAALEDAEPAIENHGLTRIDASHVQPQWVCERG
jgi:hypothetical protein